MRMSAWSPAVGSPDLALDVYLYLLGADELGDHRPARLAGRPQPDRPADVAFLERSMAARRDGDPAAGGGRGLQRRGRLDILVEIGSILEGHPGERPGSISSEEHSVGKECVRSFRSRWSPYTKKK